VVNEAALIAARTDKGVVGMEDFEGAVDRVIGGLEKKGQGELRAQYSRALRPPCRE